MNKLTPGQRFTFTDTPFDETTYYDGVCNNVFNLCGESQYDCILRNQATGVTEAWVFTPYSFIDPDYTFYDADNDLQAAPQRRVFKRTVSLRRQLAELTARVARLEQSLDK